MVLPAGTTLPPLAHATVLVAALAAVVWGLRRVGVAVTDRTLLALAPWMAAGAAAYVVYQLEVLPSVLAPFFGSPTVYATTAVLAGATWLAVHRTARPLAALGAAGGLALLVPTAIALAVGAADTLAPTVPLVGLVVGALLAWVTWRTFERLRPADAVTVGLAGPLVVFGHALDATSTAVGVDVLGFGERSPLSQLILDVAGALPTAEVIGVGWLFVLAKLLLAAGVTALLADYVREEPGEGFSLLGLVAAVGLGPGVHNLLLFVVTAPTGF